MGSRSKYAFNAKVYAAGINWCVDVPNKITSRLIAHQGRINIKGKINGYDFTKTLLPMRGLPHRLFVNRQMMKGAGTAVGQVAFFEIEQGAKKEIKVFSQPKMLKEELKKHNLVEDFKRLTASRKNDILKYLSMIKTQGTLSKNIAKVVSQLKNKDKNVRIP